MAALFASHHFPSLSLSPNTLRAPRSRRRFPLLSVRAQVESEAARQKRGLAVLWFKHDLRIDDHSGLAAAAAAKHSGIVPLYVFDHRILRRFSDEMLEMVILALEDLRDSLRSQGSNLMVRFGSVENVIPKLVKEVNATHVYAEEEVEHNLRELMEFANESLKALDFSKERPGLVLWRTPFYDVESLMDIPDSYDDFNKLQVGVLSPLPLAALPGAIMETEWGSLPTLDDLLKFVDEDGWKVKKSWTSIKEKSAASVLMREFSYPGEYNKKSSSLGNDQSFQKKKVVNSVFVTRKGSAVGGGTNNVLNALAVYLEGTARDDWQEIYEKVRNTEAREGASFTKLFGPALSLGIVSRRRVHYEAIKHEKERNVGFLPTFGYSAVSAAAAIDAVCSVEKLI